CSMGAMAIRANTRPAPPKLQQTKPQAPVAHANPTQKSKAPSSTQHADKIDGVLTEEKQPKSLDEVYSPRLSALLNGAKASDGLASPAAEVPRLQKALGLISQIDLLSPSDKKSWKGAMKLYENAFPSADEREEPKLIKSRIEGMEHLET